MNNNILNIFFKIHISFTSNVFAVTIIFMLMFRLLFLLNHTVNVPQNLACYQRNQAVFKSQVAIAEDDK